ncbi:hypothetical protein [Kushneria aurantia]|uniref:PRC-barrel domain containing protein n=1 Tax=Kushneria aurantia TaxID=504092 RepID=A0ABV6G0V2_9GAMM|nr:hypothetical protein [Kushneria aurantia]
MTFRAIALATAAATAMTGLASAHAEQTPQATEGLYSANRLLDADVHLLHESRTIGEVEDLLFGDDMTLQAMVIEIDDDGFDLDGRGYVIQRGDFTVETSNDTDLGDLEYNVIINLDRDELAAQPEWDNDWWQNARQQASQAWQETTDAASSAWQDTRQATSNLLQQAGEAIGQ